MNHNLTIACGALPLNHFIRGTALWIRLRGHYISKICEFKQMEQGQILRRPALMPLIV